MTLRAQSVPEEFANSVSHGVALLAAIAAVPFLVFASSHAGNATATTHFAGGSVFAVTMVFLYSSSTLYHALPEGRAKAVFFEARPRCHLLFYRWQLHAICTGRGRWLTRLADAGTGLVDGLGGHHTEGHQPLGKALAV